MTSFRRSLARVFAVAVVATSSAACFSSQTVIKVRADGSGTIEQTNMVNTAMLGMAAGMAKSMGSEKTEGVEIPTKPDDMFSEEQLKQQAGQLGTGVRYVSSERLTEGEMQGAKAIYAFDRIDTVTVGGSRRARGDAAAGPGAPQMQFALTPHGNQSRLTVTFPQPKTSAPDATAGTPPTMPQVPPEAFAMVKSMFEGARLGIDVEVDGRIISTNAPVSGGSRATLVEVDFGQLLSDPTKLQALQALKPGVDFATVRKTLDGMNGVKMPSEPTVTIDFGR